MTGQSHPQKQKHMAKKNNGDAAETETRKTRTPRVLSDIEVEAKQYYLDVKSFAKLLPTLNALGKTGRAKLAEWVEANPAPESFRESAQS
jgi:hypothetical protein